MTNADKLRQMTDKELYEFRFKSCPGENCVGRRCLEYSQKCKECWLAWMKEEAKMSELNGAKDCPVCKGRNLEDGDTLYQSSSWDGGVGYDYVQPVHFCPVCGRKLLLED